MGLETGALIAILGAGAVGGAAASGAFKSSPKTAPTAAIEVASAKKKTSRNRSALLETAGGVSGEEITAGGVSGRNTLLGN